MRKKLTILVIVLLAAAAVLGALAAYWTEYLWFDELGFGSIFFTQLLSQLGIGAVFGVVALVFLLGHLLLIRRNSEPRKVWTIPTAEGEIDIRELVRKVATPVVITGACAVAIGLGYLASRNWEDTLRLLHQTSFGKSEPILGKDIGFYLFVLPTMQWVQEWAVYLTGLCVVLSGVVYLLRGAITIDGRLPKMSNGVRAHLLFGLACCLLVVGWGFHVEMYETLFSKRGVAYGATYTDVNANLIAYRVMIAACVVCAVYLLVLMRAKPRDAKQAVLRPGIALGVVAALYLLGIFAWPTLVQRFIVNPNELERERPYLLNAIAGTREAYGLDKIEVKEFPATDNLTMKALAANKTTLDNIKIWDHRPLRATYSQLQVIRLYYDFPNINVDRYWIDNRYWQVMLSARELIHSQLPEQSQTWVNRHLQYTHGYGVCLSPVNQSIGEGLPDLWIKDIPPESRHASLKITRPEIYYGAKTSNYVLVKTTEKEFDYPKGSENRYTTYHGEGGVGVGTFFRRLLFALRFADVNLLLTPTLKPESRILFNRTIQERVHNVAPFLMLDQEPYMVVSEGRLFWIQDAYTITYRYPYSQPTALGGKARINYIRNSVKVVVDAYHGRMKFYVVDDKDPQIQTYRKIFPALFTDGSQMPAGIRAHLRYPQDLFAVQASMYESFHMTDPRVFYNQEDKWAVSRELGDKTVTHVGTKAPVGADKQTGVSARRVTDTARMAPYYMIMRLPGKTKEEFLLMVPYTPTNKDNMVAWMAAGCDGDNYGKLLVYTFPKQKQVFGPMQVEARIDQDEYISQWITLRNQQGSTVIRGDLLVIPIEDSILYVEPIYLEATQTKLPELKQVVVAYGKKVTMKPTLLEGLREVFGVAATPTTRPVGRPTTRPVPSSAPTTSDDAPGLARRALDAYRAGEQKLKAGDWAGYGGQQAQLRRALEELARRLEGQLRPRPATPPAPR